MRRPQVDWASRLLRQATARSGDPVADEVVAATFARLIGDAEQRAKADWPAINGALIAQRGLTRPAGPCGFGQLRQMAAQMVAQPRLLDELAPLDEEPST